MPELHDRECFPWPPNTKGLPILFLLVALGEEALTWTDFCHWIGGQKIVGLLSSLVLYEELSACGCEAWVG